MTTDLDPMDDAVDWLAGFESVSRVRGVLRETRNLARDEALRRARRATYFAGIAVDFIDSARTARRHVAFLPVYYAYLNLCKLMIACSDSSDLVEGGITHGVSYDVSQKNSQSLFTEQLKIYGRGVFPVLYKTLSGKNVPIQKSKKYRLIRLLAAYSRLPGVVAEFAMAQGSDESQLCVISWKHVRPAGNGTFVFAADVRTYDGRVFPDEQDFPALPKWKKATGQNEWESPAQRISSGADFDIEAVIDRRFLYLREAGISEHSTLAALPDGRMAFPEEVSIFLALYHLSSIVRYKPRFLETIRDSEAWPLVLAARRHLLFRGVISAVSCVLQRSVSFHQS